MILNIAWILLILSLAFCNHIQVEEKIYAGFGCLKGFPYRFQDAAGGGGTLGSGTLLCDTATKIGHFRTKWTQNCQNPNQTLTQPNKP